MKEIFVLLFTILSFSVYAEKMIDVEPVILTDLKGVNIYGSLKIPNEYTNKPLVILIAGSGPTDRNGNQPMMKNNSLKALSDSLYYRGIATLCFDKRGIGESAYPTFSEQDLRFDDYINDVKNWITLMSKDKRFSEIIVAGHSEGALIGMLAVVANKNVAKYISLSGVGEPAGQILKEQLHKQLISQPDSIKQQIFSYINNLEDGKTIDNVPISLYALFRPSVQPYMISWLKYNPQNEIAKLSIPVLILQGTTDIQVSDKQAELLFNANKQARKILIEKMNHVLKYCDSMEQTAQIPTYTNPDLPIMSDLVDAMVCFINTASK